MADKNAYRNGVGHGMKRGCSGGMLWGASLALFITLVAAFWPLAIIPLAFMGYLLVWEIDHLFNLGWTYHKTTPNPTRQESPLPARQADTASSAIALPPSEAARPVQNVAAKESPSTQTPTPIKTPALRQESPASSPGELLAKAQLKGLGVLHVHEYGLITYRGFMQNLAQSLPPRDARLEYVKDIVGGHTVIRDTDGSVFCRTDNNFTSLALRRHRKLETALATAAAS